MLTEVDYSDPQNVDIRVLMKSNRNWDGRTTCKINNDWESFISEIRKMLKKN